MTELRGGASDRIGGRKAEAPPDLRPLGGVSRLRGSGRPPLIDVTIPQMLRNCVARHGSRDALVMAGQDIRLSYRDLDRQVDQVAAGLLALGFSKGDRFGIWSPNWAEWVLTQFATARIGAILVNVNPAYRASELEYALNLSGCAALVTATRFKSSDYIGTIRELAPELACCAPGHLRAPRLLRLRTACRENCARAAIR